MNYPERRQRVFPSPSFSGHEREREREKEVMTSIRKGFECLRRTQARTRDLESGRVETVKYFCPPPTTGKPVRMIQLGDGLCKNFHQETRNPRLLVGGPSGHYQFRP